MKRRLGVEGMSCQKCVERVRKVIEKHGGTADIEVSLDAKEATFSGGEDVNVAALVKSLDEFGFTAEEKQEG